jgi:cystathionine beta-synthase
MLDVLRGAGVSDVIAVTTRWFGGVLLDALYAGTARLADKVEQHMSAPLPTVGANEAIADAVAALRDADGLVVQEDGRPVGVLTRLDLLTYLARVS